MNWKRIARMALSLAGVAVFAIILYLGGTEALSRVAHADPLYLLGALLAIGGVTLTSSLRWRLLVSALTRQPAVPVHRIYHYNIIGRVISLWAPRGVGDFAGRPLALRAGGGSSLGMALYSTVLDRLFDYILLMFMMGPALLYVAHLIPMEVAAALAAIIVGSLGFVIVTRFGQVVSWFNALLGRVAAWGSRIPVLRRVIRQRPDERSQRRLTDLLQSLGRSPAHQPLLVPERPDERLHSRLTDLLQGFGRSPAHQPLLVPQRLNERLRSLGIANPQQGLDRSPVRPRLPILQSRVDQLRQLNGIQIDASILARVYLLTILQTLMASLRSYLIARALGLHLPFVLLLLAAPVAQLGQMLAITPGALGIRELSWFGVLQAAGIPRDDLLVFLVGHRAYIYVCILVLALISQLIVFVRPQPAGSTSPMVQREESKT